MDRALARVRSPQGEVVGSGFLVDAHHVVTCTHVVLRALGRADHDMVEDGAGVAVDFPLAAPGVLLRAVAVVSLALEDEGGGDITVLSLAGELPPGLEPARLIVADDVWGHPFRAFGFPRRLDQGVWAAGVLRAPQGSGWVQMEGGASGYAVEAGFSGGAVWDDELAGAVGMTVAADARPDLRTAFLIPSSTLIRAWPRLADRTLPLCPYRGLHHFRPSDTALFFGREDVTDRLVREVLRRPLLAVVGPSGSGKSSVVFAGVVPRLRREQGWMSVSMRPAQASSPLFALAAALVPVLEPELGETERLAAANTLATVLCDGRLPDVIDRALARTQLDHLLLIVDQMEELFAREPDEAQAFTQVLLSALQPQQDARSRSLTVLLTLRADFLSNALQDPGLAEALQDSVITIGQMRREQLRAVIEGPLPPGVRYEAGLVERILGDVGDEPGSLPLLEFALTLLWERQQGGRLAHSAYQDLGGVDGALASYAERVYCDQLLPDDQEEARRLFIQLVRPTDVGSSIRRVARRSELGDPRWRLGQRLAATRLLVADRDAAGVESVELVHEALIGGWARLQQWTKADQAFRTWQEHLRGAIAAWERVQRDAGGLLHGAPLAEAERWLRERPDDLGADEIDFLAASRRAEQARVAALVAALVARRRLRTTLLCAGLVVALLAAAGISYIAIQSRNERNQQALLAQAAAALEGNPELSRAKAIEAFGYGDTPEARSALLEAASAPHGRVVVAPADAANTLIGMRIVANGTIVGFSRGGRLVLIAPSGEIRDRELPASDLHGGVTEVAPAPDASRVAVATDKGEVVVVDVATGKRTELATGLTVGSSVQWLGDAANGSVLVVGTNNAGAATFGAATGVMLVRFPDTVAAAGIDGGRYVVTSQSDKRLRVWDAAAPGPPRKESEPFSADPVFFGEDGGRIVAVTNIATADDSNVIVVWDWQSATPPLKIAFSVANGVQAVTVSPTLHAVLVAVDKRVWQYRLDDGKLWEVFPGQDDFVNDVTASTDGKWAVTAGGDGRVLVWSETGNWFPNRPTYELPGDGSSVVQGAFVGADVIALEGNGTLRHWSLAPPMRFAGHVNWVLDTDVSGDGRYIATASTEGWGYILDPADPTREKAWFGEGYALAYARFDPTDARRVYTLRRYNARAPQAWQWSASDEKAQLLPVRFTDPQLRNYNSLTDLAVSPDGNTLVAGDGDGGVHFWDAHTGRLLAERERPGTGYATGVALDRTGHVLAVTVREGVRLVDPLDPDHVLALLPLPNPTYVAFDPTGQYVAAAADGGRVAVWSTTTFQEATPTPLVAHSSRLGGLAFSPNGNLLAVGTADGRVEVWDVASGVTVALTRQHRDAVNQVRFLPGPTTRIVSASDDHTVAEWSCPACDNQEKVINDTVAGR